MAGRIRLEPGWVSSLANPPQLEDIFRCLKESTYDKPVALELTVYNSGCGNKEVTILVVPTCLRILLVEDYEEAEYTFEGWVVRPAYATGPPVWVRCDLRKTITGDQISEAGLRVLECGAELGVAPPPGFN